MARRAARRDCSGALCQQSRPSQSARGEAKDEQLRCPPSWRITASEASTYPSASYLNSIGSSPVVLGYSGARQVLADFLRRVIGIVNSVHRTAAFKIHSPAAARGQLEVPDSTRSSPKSCLRHVDLTDRFEGGKSQLSTSAMRVRRAKAALSCGCKSHLAKAPASSNRSGHGGNDMAEAFG